MRTFLRRSGLALAAIAAPALLVAATPRDAVAAGSGRTSGVHAPGRRGVTVAGPQEPPTQVGLEAGGAGAKALALPTATFAVTYTGFSTAAEAAFQAAVDKWATIVSSPVTIKVDAQWTSLGANVLGSAGPYSLFRDYSGAPVAATFYPSALADATAGSDLEPGAPDIFAQFNSSASSWSFALDGSTPANKYDFESVVLHELGHGLGVVDSSTVNNGSGSWGFDNPPRPMAFDRFVKNGSGQQLISAYPNPSTQLAAQYASNNLFFDGPRTTAAPGRPARLYAPSPYQGGSSVSHLDEAVYPRGNPNSLITPALGGGEVVHDPGSIMRRILGDTGWTFSFSGTRGAAPGDYNGNGTSDIAAWRPASGSWYVLNSPSVQWGLSSDIPVPGDYDGDGTTDIAVWRPSTGTWYVKNESNSTQWGANGDVTVPGDYNGDGITDLAVWRPSTGTWYVRNQSTVQWGTSTDVPVPGDYDGDGVTDIAVWRPSTGTWYVHNQSTTQWGVSTDLVAPGDYNGDLQTDIAVWRPSTGTWYVRNQWTTQWGDSADVPVPGDYDRDGTTDIAVWRPSTGTWYIRNQSTTQWGVSGDKPVVGLALR